jgi:cysteine synthase A
MTQAALSERRAWNAQAIRRIEADITRTSDTHLINHAIEGTSQIPGGGITLYFKDESSHPTGSLKHRLARSLFLYALCNDWIGPDTTVIEASSGSTAVSEAYFARLLGLRFIAVVPGTVAAAKIALIRFHGGEIHYVDSPGEVYEASARLAAETGGHYMDQFTYAERATDWRGNNNIAESIFQQMAREEHPIPAWVVCGAGTGGTSATIGRYLRYRRVDTQLCVADPETSIFHRHYADRSITSLGACKSSIIEGIGRPRHEPSFIPDVIDRMDAISDARSIAAMRVISARLGRPVGGSTGTNIWACARLISDMAARGQSGSVVTILCDGGERYTDTCCCDDWLAERGIDWQPHAKALESFFAAGVLIED